MRTVILLLLISLFTGFVGNTQDSIPKRWRVMERSVKTDLVLGYNWQANWRDDDNNNTMGYIEVGVGRSIHNTGGYHGGPTARIYISEEIHFGSTNIYGTKVGAYTHFWLIDVGASLVYYTDFKKGNLKFRPELGFGGGPVRAVFGFNIPTIDNKAFEKLRQQRAQVTVQVMVPIHKKVLKTN